MIKFVILCLCVGLSIQANTDCTLTNDLRTKFGFGNTVTTAANAGTLNYCNSIKTAPVCCTAAEINGLQTKADNLLKSLTDTVSTRDKYWKTVSGANIQQLQNAAQSFATTAQEFALLPQGSTAADLANSQAILASLTELSTGIGAFSSAYKVASTSLSALQTARRTCVEKIGKLQAAAWCLSCDPDAGTKGYNTGTKSLDLSATTCDGLKAACYPWVSTSSYQNGPIAIQATIDAMNKFTALVQKMKSGTKVDIAEFGAAPTTPPVGDTPASCTSQADCNWICDGLYEDGLVNGDNLAAGGETGDGSRLLEENDRILQSGTYQPADDESGVSVTFSDNPGGVSETSGVLSFGSVLIGVVVLLSSYLL